MVTAHRPQLARATDAAAPRTLVQILLESAERFRIPPHWTTGVLRLHVGGAYVPVDADDPDERGPRRLRRRSLAWWLRVLGARIGAGGTVGPASLVMRGGTVPAGTYWIGNPVSPWASPPDTSSAAVPAREAGEP